MELSQHVKRLKPSPTLALNQKAKELVAEGKSIVNLTVGEPDFATPSRIIQAGYEALKRGETKYTVASGIPELKDAIRSKVKGEYGRSYSRKEVVVSAGGKQALFNLCLSVLNPGDEVVIFSPYWVSYPSMIEFAGGKTVVVEAREEEGFAPNPSSLAKALSDKTRILMINSPCNPTGAVYSKAVLQSLLEAVKKYPNLLVVTDDIYEKLVFDGEDFCSIGMDENLPQDRLVIISGVSKSYAMTGWRIGWALGPESIIKGMSNIQSQSTSNPAAVSQWAALEAIAGDQSDVEEMCRLFQERRDLMVNFLKKIPGVSVDPPKGAFYVFPNISRYLGKKTKTGTLLGTDAELAQYLLEDCGIAVVPGSAFGTEGYFRLSLSAAPKDLEEGLTRLKNGFEALT